MMRSTRSSLTMLATPSALPTRSSSPTSGSVAMTVAWAWLTRSFSRTPLRTLQLADHQAALDRQAAPCGHTRRARGHP